jgi:uncharacterized protein DUF6463
MTSWISKWIMFVAVGHATVAMIFFGNTYREIIQNGLYNTVLSEKIGLAVWFLLFGFLLFIFGMLLAVIEKNNLSKTPKSIGVALLLLTTLGVVLMPVSGFWLLFPAALAILLNKRNDFE